MRAIAKNNSHAKHRITTDVALRDIGLRFLRLVSDLYVQLSRHIYRCGGSAGFAKTLAHQTSHLI
jgi:hypothetical protein